MSTFETETPGPRLGAGREADVYALGDTSVLKLYRPGFGGHSVEATALRSLEGRGIAPKLLDVLEYDGRTGAPLPGARPMTTTRARSCCCGGPLRCPTHP